jgi:Protein of unknown function (DUF2723)
MYDGQQQSQELWVETESPEAGPFLQRADWLSFAVTGLLTFGVYLFTLNPSLDLDFSGINATGAMYPGVPHVPGFPLWTIYAHLFIKLLPISNIVWRVNVASAVASALTCATIALLTSRCSGALLLDLQRSRKLEPKDELKLRVVCGCVAGLALGFGAMFWNQAVRATAWNFTLLLLIITLSFFLRWQHSPEQIRWFYFACFKYGLTLTNSQAILSAALGIGCLILFTKPSLARDVFTAVTLFIAMLLAGEHYGFVNIGNLFGIYIATGITTFLIAIVLVTITRKFFTHWRTVIAGTLCFLAGLAFYLFVPIFSMTNPPMNWGYPRTVDGFWHVISRGQYESVHAADCISRFADCLIGYAIQTQKDYGFIYVCAAIIPFLFLRRFQTRQRKWLLGFFALYLSLSVFMVYVLNPSLDKASQELNGRFYPASHMMLSILCGCGLAVLGLFLGSSQQTGSNNLQQVPES